MTTSKTRYAETVEASRFAKPAPIEVLMLTTVGTVQPDPNGELPMVDAAFTLIGKASRDIARSDEKVTGEFRFTDAFATWSVEVTIDPIERQTKVV